MVDLQNPFAATGAIQSLLSIQNKHRLKVPFKFNKAQADLASHWTGREIILKSRQQGMSSAILAAGYVLCAFTEGYSFVVVSQELGATKRLLDRVRYYHEQLPEELRPRLSRDNRGEMRFPDTGSTLFIGTAGSSRFGRGDTIHFVHFSEPAFYDAIIGKDLVTGLSEAVPSDGWISYESTPNGRSGLFWDACQAAQREGSPFKLRFYPWWWADEYKSTDKRYMGAPLSEVEEALVLRHHLNMEQITWRRGKIAAMEITNPGKGEVTFRQEYPSDPVSCFLASGACFFPSTAIDRHLLRVVPPIMEEDSGLWVWRSYNPGHRYVVVLDPSEGIEAERESDAGDYSGLAVLDAHSGEIVAGMRRRVDVTTLAGIGLEVAKRYGQALLGLESTGMGIALVSKVAEAGYSNVYCHRMADGTYKMGFPTNSQTRPLVLQDFYDGLRDGGLTLYDERIVDEASSFVRKPNGRIEASAGAHDDLLFSAMIAWHLRQEALIPMQLGAPKNVSHL